MPRILAHTLRVRILLAAAVVVPIGFAAFTVFRYGLDVPFWDEWKIAELLHHYHDGTLTLAELLVQHNEHRMVTSRVIHLLVALAIGWDTRVLMWMGQAFLAATLAGCVWLWRR